MPTVAADAQPLPKAARLVADTIDSSGHRASRIAECSDSTARDFSQLDASLKGAHFSPSFLSRSRNGQIEKPCREKMIVLKLTLLRLDDPQYPNWSDSQRKAALDKAVAFAKQVSAAVVESRGADAIDSSSNMSARYARTVELFGAHGEFMLRQLGENNTGETEARLALLHQLSGDGDDARYWKILAAKANPGYSPPSSQQELFVHARRYAAEYQRAHDLATARVYLNYAADCGDGISAFQLGQMAELEDDVETAIDWYYRATDLGYPDGRQRVERLKPPIR